MLAKEGQRFGDWLSRRSTSVAEQYLEGDLAVEIRFRWQRNIVDFSYGLATIYRDKKLVRRDDWRTDIAEIFVDGRADSKPDSRFRVYGPYRNNQSVFVEPVELVKGKEKLVAERAIVPSLVWLQVFDSFDSFRACTIETPSGVSHTSRAKNRQNPSLGRGRLGVASANPRLHRNAPNGALASAERLAPSA